MHISILCTNPEHPVIKSLREWISDMSLKGHVCSLVYDKSQLQKGDILFLVSCSQIVSNTERKRFKATLVLHASDLPKGRGWSPYIWEIINGANLITVSLLEAEDQIDNGAIWLKKEFNLQGHELLPEIYEKLFRTQLQLMTKAVESFQTIVPKPQSGEPGKYYRKRTPSDSRLDPEKSIAEQFNLLRVVDFDRFPAFFDFCGQRYFIKIKKTHDES
ncbi:formyltransferase family protein [Thermodesulfobacteriota bacterium]